MHRKIKKMGQRIRQLEDALAILQASVSSEPHPLLGEEYTTKFPFKRSEANDATQVAQVSVSELADELGTLDLLEGGHARYVGRLEGSEEVRPIY